MYTSVFDLFKIGIGPSSSHTVGPMKASGLFIQHLISNQLFEKTSGLQVELFGSLAYTGKGHHTDKAILLGLSGFIPELLNPQEVEQTIEKINQSKFLSLNQKKKVFFEPEKHFVFNLKETKPAHSNAMEFTAFTDYGNILTHQLYYSIGGGFVVSESDINHQSEIEPKNVPYLFTSGDELLNLCKSHDLLISDLILKNEMTFQTKTEIESQLSEIWKVMDSCIYSGFQTKGTLSGGLKVKRRAPKLFESLQNEKTADPLDVMDWINVYAIAVCEENASGGRVVTAPTNGAAGIIPAVIKYYDTFIPGSDENGIFKFLLTAAAIGMLYKRNASISGAEAGCQGEVGVACSMAAAGLTATMGGSNDEIENAAEIGMEHNLGLTCDPVGGLVQIPCIERNAMGAMKAINASRIALRGKGEHKVSLDQVIATMWQTGKDMQSIYKETSQGGLAVNVVEC